VLGVQALIMGVLEIIGGFTGGGLGSFILGVIYVLAGLVGTVNAASSGCRSTRATETTPGQRISGTARSKRKPPARSAAPIGELSSSDTREDAYDADQELPKPRPPNGR
jgi:hypothetical protein